MVSPYEYPEYYDFAFSFRDIPHEVDVMEQVMENHSQIPVRRVLEMACGNSPHCHEFRKRGYSYHGLDASASMLNFAREKVGDDKDVHLHQGDMASFHLPQQVDFAYLMLGSLYVENQEGLQGHFQSVAEALRPGGLYFLDWCVSFAPLSDYCEEWTMEKEGLAIETFVRGRCIHSIEQIVEEELELRIVEEGIRKTARGKTKKRMIYPQEFLLLLQAQNLFEFVGWWNNWDLNWPLSGKEEISRPIIIIRRLGGR